MVLTSTAFNEGEKIPVKYTCDGEDISPPLSWSNAPEGTKSFALISDDPDAPMGIWVHWVIFNIPSDVNNLPEDIPADGILDDGTVHGTNDFRMYGYGGPCPPGGTHRYYFKLYALDTVLDLEPGASKKTLERSIKKHILGQAQLMGTYSR